MSLHDEIFMREALLEAKKAFVENEVPIGAVLVLEGKIIARSYNRVEQMQDASYHAELLCLKEGARLLGNWRLKNAVLYCTLEPCAMCAGAMILFRIQKLIYGARDLRHGAHGSIFDVLTKPHPIHQIEVKGGVCEQKAKELMQEFFRMRRRDHIGKTI